MSARVSDGLLAAAEARAALGAMFARAWGALEPAPPLSIIEWAETYRVLSPEETSMPGRYSLEMTPALRGILAAASDPDVRRIASQKSAQVGYTAGVVCNVLGYHIHWRPSVQVVMFPREKSAKDFATEKLEPMLRATPVLAERVNLRTRRAGEGATRRRYEGGLLKLVASNTPSDVKSTSGRIGVVEEPDDTKKNVAGQGSAIALIGERTKTYAPDDLQLIGGTPTSKGGSFIVQEMRSTDQRQFLAECHHCGEAHTPEWAHVTIPGFGLSDEDKALPKAELDARWPEREIYGRARWEEAFYTCPHCGGIWTDEDRIENIRRAARVPPMYGWVPTAESSTPGFYLNELLSVFDGSHVPLLAQKFLIAQHDMDRGDPEKMVAFWNSTRGLPWEFNADLPEEDELRERSEPYAEWTCPAGGLVPVMFVDVQHDRLAVTVWVVGLGEEMWLAYWGEFYGQTIQPHVGAWIELEAALSKTVKHASGADLRISAVGIDTADGQTSDASYSFVRKHNVAGRPVLATRGAPDAVGRVEILTKAKPVEIGKKPTKAAKYGVLINVIGAAKAKDLILGWAQQGGRVRLRGNGPGRMHWYQGVRDDFFEQLLGEAKLPGKRNPRVREWTERADRRNEALDCTVGCLWLSRRLKLHLLRASQWAAIAARVQRSAPGVDPAAAAPEPQQPAAVVPQPAQETPKTDAPVRRFARRRRGSLGGGFR